MKPLVSFALLIPILLILMEARLQWCMPKILFFRMRRLT